MSKVVLKIQVDSRLAQLKIPFIEWKITIKNVKIDDFGAKVILA